jgi:FkbM family methyltransferase
MALLGAVKVLDLQAWTRPPRTARLRSALWQEPCLDVYRHIPCMKHLSECECSRIIKRLKRLPAPMYYAGSATKLAAAWRLLALRLACRNVVPLTEILRPAFLSPTTQDPRMIRVRDVVCNGYVIDCVGRWVAADYDGVEIYGKLASPAMQNAKAWADFLLLFYQVVMQDQYHTKECLRPDSTVIDGGANIGLFSLVASQLTPKGKVYAFEPARVTSAALRKNTRDCKNIEVLAQGLGDKARKADMLVHGGFPSGSTVSDSGMPQFGVEAGDLVAEEISITTIDDFAKERNLDRVDFIKVDAEGYEKQILRGASQTIARFRPILAVSAYHFPNDRTDIVNIIEGITPEYTHKCSSRAEEDLLFLPKK